MGLKVRLNLEIPVKVRDLIEQIQQQTGAASMTEVIRRALLVLYALLQAAKNGDDLVIKREGKETIILITMV